MIPLSRPDFISPVLGLRNRSVQFAERPQLGSNVPSIFNETYIPIQVALAAITIPKNSAFWIFGSYGLCVSLPTACEFEWSLSQQQSKE